MTWHSLEDHRLSPQSLSTYKYNIWHMFTKQFLEIKHNGHSANILYHQHLLKSSLNFNSKYHCFSLNQRKFERRNRINIQRWSRELEKSLYKSSLSFTWAGCCQSHWEEYCCICQSTILSHINSKALQRDLFFSVGE